MLSVVTSIALSALFNIRYALEARPSRCPQEGPPESGPCAALWSA